MAFVLSLVIASFVGTVIWFLQNSIKLVTQNVFSQTWHYYTGLIPVFFLLGGSEIMNRLVSFIRSISPDIGTTPVSGTVSEHYVHVTPTEQLVTSSLYLLKQQFDYLLRFSYTKEFAVCATVIWAVGAIVFLAVHIQKYRAFKRSVLQESWICDTVQCPVKVIVSAHAATPMVMGLWRPMVVLPDTRLGEQELAMILSHELVHLKRGDLLVKLLVLLANAVHWFNPAAYSLTKQINTDCELSCDEKVVQEMNTENRRIYGETLLTMLEYGVMQRYVVFTSSLCSPKKAMKRRLMNVMKEKTMKKPVLALSLVVAIVLVVSGGAATYAAGTAVPTRTAEPIVIPTGKQDEGRNVYVQSADGTTVYYDRQGNKSPATVKTNKMKPFDEKTQKKIDELHGKIQSYLDKGLPVPQDITNEFTPEEIQAALNGISSYVYDEKGVRPYTFDRN